MREVVGSRALELIVERCKANPHHSTSAMLSTRKKYIVPIMAAKGTSLAPLYEVIGLYF